MIDKAKVLGTVAYLGGLMALPEAFCWAWGNFRAFNEQFVCNPGEQLHYTRSTVSLHAHARNALCAEMQGEFLLMLDTDVLVEPDTLLKLLTVMKRYNVPIVSGVYRHKVPPHHAVIWTWEEEESGFVKVVDHDARQPCFRVDCVGGGCLLIHASALRKLHMAFPDQEPFDHIGKYGEDFSFCLRCREAGIPIYVTPHVDLAHVMAYPVTGADYVPNWWPLIKPLTAGVPQEVVHG